MYESSNISTDNGPNIKASMTLGGGTELTIGLYETISLKYQMYSSPLESAEQGNISIASSLGYIQANSVGSNGAGIRSNDRREWDAKQHMFDLALIAGYRFSEKLLSYCLESRFSDNGNSLGVSLSLEYAWTPWLITTGELGYNRSSRFDRKNNESVANVNLEFRF